MEQWECHIDPASIDGGEPQCIGECPPGYVCQQEVNDIGGGEYEVCCVCVPDSSADMAIEFSLDIGSDTELSDPQFDGDEGFDPGDVYLWQGPPVLPPPGRNGFKDDWMIFGQDPAPTPGMNNPVPVGQVQDPRFYLDVFDLDGHDQIDFEPPQYISPEFPVNQPIPPNAFSNHCIHPLFEVAVSFDDDDRAGWLNMDVPVLMPSPMGMLWGTSAGMDEVIGITLQPSGTGQYTVLNVYPVADEVTVHQDLWPDPDCGDPQDDDVDSLDIVPGNPDGTAGCQYWLFSADHEATIGLDPGDIYYVDTLNPGSGPIPAIDDVIHLGIPDETDVDAFELVIYENENGSAALALAFSVDTDDPLTAPNESGGLMPGMIYVSFLNGMSFPAMPQPLEDDVDAIMNWYQMYPIAQPQQPPQITAWRSVAQHVGSSSTMLLSIPLDPSATGPGVVSECRRNGVERIEVDFDMAVSLVNPPLISDANSGMTYTPSSISWAAGNQTLIMNFAGGLPSPACYTIDLACAVAAQGTGAFLGGDPDCMVRSLPGDTSNDGITNVNDFTQTRAMNHIPAATNPRFDVSLDLLVNVNDATLVRSLNGLQTTCP
jgi:hypothetical protein